MIRSKATIQEIRNYILKIRNSKDFNSLKYVISDMANTLEHFFIDIESIVKKNKELEELIEKKEREDKRAGQNIDHNLKVLANSISKLQNQLDKLK